MELLGVLVSQSHLLTAGLVDRDELEVAPLAQTRTAKAGGALPAIDEIYPASHIHVEDLEEKVTGHRVKRDKPTDGIEEPRPRDWLLLAAREVLGEPSIYFSPQM